MLTASDILAEAAFLAGYDVKKSEVHGMSQRGGSVASDVRFGTTVFSPMVPPGEADFLLVLADDQVDNNRPRLREGGVLIAPQDIQQASLPNRRSANVALLGVLSRHLPDRRRHVVGGHPQEHEARVVRGQPPGVRARPQRRRVVCGHFYAPPKRSGRRVRACTHAILGTFRRGPRACKHAPYSVAKLTFLPAGR